MNDLIYLSLQTLLAFDFSLARPEYKHRDWFQLYQALEWPSHTTSRVHKLDTPWPLADTVAPIPTINHNNTNFDQILETVAERFVKENTASGRRPYLAWSGGIDSTCILVSLLKVANQDFLQRLVILHNDNSIKENAYFYHRYIQGKLQTQNIDTFQITTGNHDRIVLLDGEGGNQLMGWRAINTLSYYRQFDMLDRPWRSVQDLTELFPGSNQFHVDLVLSSLPHAPVPIETVYDLIWWTNFNFKFDEVLLRKIVTYTGQLTAQQTHDFYHRGLYRFYAQPELQVWSMISKDLRREKTRTVSKYFPKQYIYDFDHNHWWWANKKEEGSSSLTFYKTRFAFNNPVIAVDKYWNKYNMSHAKTRRALAEILKKDTK